MARLKEKTRETKSRRSIPDLAATQTAQKGKEIARVPSRGNAQDASDEEESDEGVEMNVDGDEGGDSDEKDETEAELERLVFGDSAGFREGLRAFGLDDVGGEGDEEEDEEEASGDEESAEGLADADVGSFRSFFSVVLGL